MRYKAVWHGSENDAFWNYLLEFSIIEECAGSAADADLQIINLPPADIEVVKAKCKQLQKTTYNLMLVLEREDALECYEALTDIPFVSILTKDITSPDIYLSIIQTANGIPFHDRELAGRFSSRRMMEHNLGILDCRS